MKRNVRTYLLFLPLLVMLGLAGYGEAAFAACGTLSDDGSFNCSGYTDSCGGACVSADYINSISGTESGGRYNCTAPNSTAVGRYQFLNGTRDSLCKKYSCLPCVSRQAFANCPALQDAYFQAFNRDNWQTLQNCGAASKVGQTINGQKITESCLLAMAHLRGAGNGSPSSPGACGFVNHGWDKPDANGTTMAKYCQTHGGVDAFDGSGTCKVPPGTSGGGGGGGGGGGTTVPPPTGGLDLPVIVDSCGVCSCTLTEARATIQYIVQQHENTRAFITEQFKIHEDWLFGANRNFGGAHDSFFELHMLPALMMMTEQLVTTGMEQMLILGTFFDAKLELETQQLFQEKAAEAHKDYQPATGMCVIGTTARGLAAADRNGEFTSFVMSQRSQDRQLGIFNLSAAFSSEMDREGRIRQVKERYCDMKDNNGNMEELCENGNAKPENVNKDIDFTRTVDLPRTLNIDFTDGTLTGDEQDVLALQNNLFADTVLDKLRKGPGGLEAAEGSYMEMRGVIAKRSIAENSYNSIIGQKTAGTEASEKTIPFTEKMLQQFGIDDENERRLLLGGTKDDGKTAALRPSYYAQMEVLAQKIYQDPRFYTNLYDTPANVMRKKVAMQAIDLMLKRDMYKSEERSEMVMSVWLEMELMEYQNDIQNRLNAMMEEHGQN